MTQLPEETKKRLTEKKIKSLLKGLDASSLCDIKKDLRVMSPDIRRIRPQGPYPLTPLIGRARTVSVLDDFLTVIKALHEAEAGEVLAVPITSNCTYTLTNPFESDWVNFLHFGAAFSIQCQILLIGLLELDGRHFVEIDLGLVVDSQINVIIVTLINL